MKLPTTDRLWVVGEDRIAGVIYGDMPNKSNSRQIVHVKGRPLVIKSGKARKLSQRFMDIVAWSQLPPGSIPLKGATNAKDLKDGVPTLYLHAHVYGDFRRDLDVELLPDLLQKSNVIMNDRAVRFKKYAWTYEPETPRVEFEVGVERAVA